MVDFKLKYDILADASKAKREVNSFHNDVTRLGGGVTSALGGVPALASAAATGIVAIGAATVVVTKQLFDLTKQAAEYGSTIFDASQKTGLAAETLSAMDFAAKQSDTSLEQLTGGIGRFSKSVGAAIDGSKEATANLVALGIDPQEAMADLDAALAKVFKRISDAKPGIEQITLAQKAFGKSGADLLPFIKSFDGDLAGLVKRAKELGVTIDDEAARAADEFGDQLDTLNAQFAAVGRTIGMAFMPQFMDMARATSEWAVRNKGEIEQWANAFAVLTRGVISDLGRVVNFARENESLIRVVLAVMSLGNTERAAALGSLLGARYKQQAIARGPDAGLAVMPGSVLSGTFRGGGIDTGAAARSRQNEIDRRRREAERAAREAEQRERERIARFKENIGIEIDEKRASIETLIQLEEQRFEEGVINEAEYVRNVREHEQALAGFVIEAQNRILGAVRNNAEERKRVESQIKILNAQNEKTLSGYATDDAKRKKETEANEKKLHDERKKRWKEHIENLIRIDELEDAERDRSYKEMLEIKRRNAEAGMATRPGSVSGGIMRGLGVDLIPMFDEVTNAALTFEQRMAMVWGNVKDMAGQAIGGMIDGLAQMGAAWLVTGEFSAKAALQMAAGAALGIAMQAGVKAIFEFAEAAAAAARFDFYSAAMHKAAAVLYLKTAAVAGAIGVGLGLAGRAVGNSEGGGGASSSGAGASGGGGGRSSRSNEPDMTPISRFNDDTFISGMRPKTMREIIGLARAIEKLEAKISMGRPGDIVQRGIDEKPGLIGRTFVNEVSNNGGLATKTVRVLGGR